MIGTKAITIIEFALSAVLLVLGIIGYCAVHSYIKHHGETKKLKNGPSCCLRWRLLQAGSL